MSKYSIKDLENLSGVKAHTIRIWEKRYGLLVPERTDTNIRYYSDAQLKRLLNVSLMLGFGYKISKISSLSEDELNHAIKDHLVNGAPLEKDQDFIVNKINGLIVSMIELNEEKFNQIFATSVVKRGFEETILKVVYPFLEKVGIMWTIDELNPAQEHFISNLIRQKIIVALDQLAPPVHPKATFVLYLPESEMHELGLLLANYFLKKRGYKTVYLGQDVPFADVEKVVSICHPEGILTFSVVGAKDFDLLKYIQKAGNSFSKQKIYLAGSVKKIENQEIPKNVELLTSVEQFVSTISE